MAESGSFKFQVSIKSGQDMLNIRADDGDEFELAIATARNIPALAPYFVNVPQGQSAPAPAAVVAPAEAVSEAQAVANVVQAFQAEPVAQAPAVVVAAPPQATSVAVQQPQQVGPPCEKCGAQKYMRQKKDGTGYFPACPNWKPKPTPGTLEHK